MLKSLRIAVTAVSLTACVLLVALWVRSYKQCDIFCLGIDRVPGQWLQSLDGKLTYDGRASLVKSGFGWIVHPAKKSRLPEDYATKPVLGFQWAIGGEPRPMIPHWFPIFVFAALAGLAWLDWRRFSLRTLLLFVTVAASMMGAMAYFVSMAPPPSYQTTTIAPASDANTSEDDLFSPF